jgi:hypothetical protein
MAGFQLAGPAADVSKILFGESRKLYQSPNEQHNFDHFADSSCCEGRELGEDRLDEEDTTPSQWGIVWVKDIVLYARAPHTNCDFHNTEF